MSVFWNLAKEKDYFNWKGKRKSESLHKYLLVWPNFRKAEEWTSNCIWSPTSIVVLYQEPVNARILLNICTSSSRKCGWNGNGFSGRQASWEISFSVQVIKFIKRVQNCIFLIPPICRSKNWYSIALHGTLGGTGRQDVSVELCINIFIVRGQLNISFRKGSLYKERSYVWKRIYLRWDVRYCV